MPDVDHWWQRPSRMSEKIAMRLMTRASRKVVNVEVGVQLQTERTGASPQLFEDRQNCQVIPADPKQKMALVQSSLGDRSRFLLPAVDVGQGLEGKFSQAESVLIGPSASRSLFGLIVALHLAQSVG